MPSPDDETSRSFLELWKLVHGNNLDNLEEALVDYGVLLRNLNSDSSKINIEISTERSACKKVVKSNNTPFYLSLFIEQKDGGFITELHQLMKSSLTKTVWKNCDGCKKECNHNLTGAISSTSEYVLLDYKKITIICRQ